MRKIYFLSFVVLLIQYSYSQTASLLQTAKIDYPLEQLFVHCDKGSYLAGETIWMKAYVMADELPSSENSSLKVQLIANDSSVIAEKVYPVINSIATGNISLPINIKEGQYFIRAITNTALQKKYAKEFIAPILIYNPTSLEKINDSSFAYKQIPSIQFYQANTLIHKFPNQCYVSVIDQYHQPMQTSGWLMNSVNDTVSFFKTDYSGAAEIKFVPDSSVAYFIKLNDNKTQQKIVAPIKSEGTVMITDYTSKSYFITILSTADTNKIFHLIGEVNNRELFEVNAINGHRIEIPIAQLPTGIFRIVLTDENNSTIAERFLFSNNERSIISVKNISSTINTNDTLLSHILLQTADTINTTLSLSLMDKEYDFGKNTQQENIINRFLLTAHLQGEHTAFSGLIENISIVDVNTINNILATNKILKPDWNEIISIQNERKKITDSADYIKIQGAVIPEGFKNFPKGATLNLIFESKDSTKDFINLPLIISNKKASIALKGLVFYDTLTLYYKLNDKNYQSVKLKLDSINPTGFFPKENKTDFKFLSYYSSPQLRRIAKVTDVQLDKKEMVFKNLSDEILTAQKALPTVTVTSYKTWRQKAMDVSDRYGEDMFRREAEQMFDFINSPYVAATRSVAQYLKLFGRRMQVIGDDMTTTNIIQWPVLWTQKPYTIFIDGARVDYSDLDVLTISNVAMIKVYHNFILADENGPAIAVFTKHPEDRDKGTTNLQTIQIAGYNSGLIFMNPEKQYLKYINKKNLLGTFYWSPFLFWNNQQKEIKLDFYNINQSKESKLIIQGMNADGKLVYLNKTILSK